MIPQDKSLFKPYTFCDIYHAILIKGIQDSSTQKYGKEHQNDTEIQSVYFEHFFRDLFQMKKGLNNM